MSTERSAQQREPLDLGGLVASLREWADKIEGDPSGIVAFFLRFAFAETAMVEFRRRARPHPALLRAAAPPSSPVTLREQADKI